MKNLNILFVGFCMVALACTPKVAEKTAETESPKNETSAAPESNMAMEVLNNYINAIGGKDAIMAVQDVSTEMEANTGMGAIEMKSFVKGGKYAMQVMAQGMTVQEIKFDGNKAMMGGMQGNQEVTDEKQLEGFRTQSKVCPEMEYLGDGYKMSYEGEENLKGTDVHVIKVLTPQGATVTEYYSKSDKLKLRTIGEQEMQGQKQTVKTSFSDYREVGGIKFPHSISISGPMPFDLNLEVTSLKVNEGVSDALFEIN